ncbi:MAG: archease [Thermodesulfobacteriota bacterium]
MKDRGGPPYTLINHTADMGVRIRGSSLKELFENAALALTDLLVSPGRHGEPAPFPLSVTGDDPVDLLVRWMGEVLYLFEGEARIVADVRIETLTSDHIEAVARVFPFDPDRDEPLNQIKAVTYHKAGITETDGQWEALLVLDV